jgi:hypothetical protein
MKKTSIIAFWAACVILVNTIVLFAQQKSEPSALGFYSIGFPAQDQQPAAWNINVLKIFNNRLYLGYGDATVNTGPTDVIYYDLDSNKFVKEFSVDDEGIYQYQVIDDKLVIPGVDATEEWDFGNIYIREKSGWVKHRSITRGVHVFDAVSYKGKWYVGTGNYCELTKEESFGFGAILGSADTCKTWTYEYITPSDKNAVYRINALISFSDKLYAFPYAYVGFTMEEIPAEYRPYMMDPYNEDGKDYYLVSLDGAFGSTDAICYDGKMWRSADLVPDSLTYRTRPVVFKDKLILSVVSGKYIGSLSEYISKNGKLPANARTALYAFDGQKTERLDFEYELIRDIISKQDKLYILYFNRGQNLIAETADLKTWKYYLLPESVKKPLSIETDGQIFYVGTFDGNIFKAQPIVQDKSTSYGSRFPRMFYGAAETASEAFNYWAAVTGWQTLGRTAKYSCEAKPGNIIEVSTENISGLEIFIPFDQIDPKKPLTLNIDGKEVFKGDIRGYSSLACAYQKMGWTAKKGKGTPEKFKVKDIVVGKAVTDLTRKGDDPLAGNWLAEVYRWAVNADIGFTTRGSARKDIKKGDILVSDIFKVNYRNTVCIFRAKGSDIKRMLEFNIRQPGKGDKIQVSGMVFSYKADKDPQKNEITDFWLDPEKIYTVSVPDYVVREAKAILGEAIEADDTKESINAASVRWLQKNKTIGKIKPRIKIVR